MNGTLFLVGAGPGDPELLTLKAVRILSEATTVVLPQKQGVASLAQTIADQHIAPSALRLPFEIPMQRQRQPAQDAYDRLALELAPRLQAGERIVYLCEGDPLFYGSAMYLIARLSEFGNIEIVPGVTSLTASAAALGRPLVARNDVLKILPAPLPDDVLRHELESADAVAIIKLGSHFDRISKLLHETGHAASAMMVVRASQSEEQVLPLADVPPDLRPYFAMILTYRGTEDWAEKVS